jgi:hypothetical protein
MFQTGVGTHLLFLCGVISPPLNREIYSGSPPLKRISGVCTLMTFPGTINQFRAGAKTLRMNYRQHFGTSENLDYHRTEIPTRFAAFIKKRRIVTSCFSQTTIF